MPMENTLVIHDLNISFGGKKVFENFSISIPKGQFVAITGNNGSGKSTLMKAILGILPFSGHIHLDAKKVGYLPQSFTIDRSFPISIYDFLKLSLKAQESFDKEKLLSVITTVNLLDQKDLFLNELSQGQFQRVLFARSILVSPDFLVLDEPLSNIDEETALHLRNILVSLNKQGTTILLSIHDSRFISETCNQVISLGGTSSFIIDQCFHDHGKRDLT